MHQDLNNIFFAGIECEINSYSCYSLVISISVCAMSVGCRVISLNGVSLCRSQNISQGDEVPAGTSPFHPLQPALGSTLPPHSLSFLRRRSYKLPFSATFLMTFSASSSLDLQKGQHDCSSVWMSVVSIQLLTILYSASFSFSLKGIFHGKFSLTVMTILF